MASPQTANGYARVANELLRAIYRFPFSGQELRVVLWVIRQTYGWKGRKETLPTPVRALGEDVFMPTATVGWVTKGLRERSVLVRMPNGGWKLNKNYDEWLERGSGQLALRAGRPDFQGKPPRGAKQKPLTEAVGFKAPTLEAVQAYCAERKSTVDAEKFYHHYTATGWVSGKGNKPITNWKSMVCFWERSAYVLGPNGKTGAAAAKPCPLCDAALPYPGAIVCTACGARCRACGRETAALKIVNRRDGTKTAQCAPSCPKGEVPAIARAAVPQATKKLEQERRDRFMEAHRRRSAAAKELP